MKVEALSKIDRLEIFRVANGWVIADASYANRGGVALSTAVAESPAMLADIISEWAKDQEKQC